MWNKQTRTAKNGKEMSNTQFGKGHVAAAGLRYRVVGVWASSHLALSIYQGCSAVTLRLRNPVPRYTLNGSVHICTPTRQTTVCTVP